MLAALTATLLAALLPTWLAGLLVLLAGFLLLATLLTAFMLTTTLLTALLAGALVLVAHWELLLQRDHPASGKRRTKALVPKCFGVRDD